MTHEHALIPLFEQFILDSKRGKRLKPDGTRIKPQSIDNYSYVLKLLIEFSKQNGQALRVRSATRLTTREVKAEQKYWKKFYRDFTDFLYRNKKYYDNYVGGVIKIIRSFFGYMNKERIIITGDFYKSFHKREEIIDIITFLPEQLQFLIHDREFESSLDKHLREAKDIVVVGCTVALRFSDLFNINFRDIAMVGANHYLTVRSIKTGTLTRIKLPQYVVEIFERLRKGKSPGSKIFKSISLNAFNNQLRRLSEAAGWTHEIAKQRSQNGLNTEIFKDRRRSSYRFCDRVSSHIMRRTAITTMLMLGMPENLVRQISGHAPNSKAFYRYVNYVQTYLDQEIDKIHNKLLQAG